MPDYLRQKMSQATSEAVVTRTILVAIGGPTNSGKTLLAKNLLAALPTGDAFIIHQDDFAPVSRAQRHFVQTEMS